MRLVIYITTLLFLYSCTKDELGPQCVNCDGEVVSSQPSDLLIVNEGNFGAGNGSISLYHPANHIVTQNIFFQTNNTQLGDVVQSITQINNKAYIVVNNSSKIEVVDIHNFTSLATITGFNSPRFLLPVNANKAYVTDLYSNSVQIINLNTNNISGTISLSGWTENLLLHNDTVYVCDRTNDNLLIIDAITDALIDSVKIGKQPNSMVIDQNNKIWILCDGGYNSTNPELIKYNPQTRSIESTFVFPNISNSPNNLTINANGNQLYFINGNIYTININDSTLPINALASNNSSIFYGLAIDPINNDIYVSDAIDYVQNGVVFRYDYSGLAIDQFQSGINPNGFLFIQ